MQCRVQNSQGLIAAMAGLLPVLALLDDLDAMLPGLIFNAQRSATPRRVPMWLVGWQAGCQEA